MVNEILPVVQGTQLTLLVYLALEISQIKRAMKNSEAINYQSPAIITEFIPLKVGR